MLASHTTSLLESRQNEKSTQRYRSKKVNTLQTYFGSFGGVRVPSIPNGAINPFKYIEKANHMRFENRGPWFPYLMGLQKCEEKKHEKNKNLYGAILQLDPCRQNQQPMGSQNVCHDWNCKDAPPSSACTLEKSTKFIRNSIRGNGSNSTSRREADARWLLR